MVHACRSVPRLGWHCASLGRTATPHSHPPRQTHPLASGMLSCVCTQACSSEQLLLARPQAHERPRGRDKASLAARVWDQVTRKGAYSYGVSNAAARKRLSRRAGLVGPSGRKVADSGIVPGCLGARPARWDDRARTGLVPIRSPGSRCARPGRGVVPQPVVLAPRRGPRRSVARAHNTLQPSPARPARLLGSYCAPWYVLPITWRIKS